MAKFCSNCGKKLNGDADICLSCGKIVNEEITESIKNKETTKSSPDAKSKIAAGILGIILGYLGIHNFYLGYTGKAIAQLLITILSWGTLFPVSFIWGLIEGIMILTGSINKDANGKKLIN